MQDYTPNSHKYKQEQNKPVETKKEIQKVVKGKVKVKKKTAAQSAIDTFVKEDLVNIKTSLVSDIIIPTIKNMIWDGFTSALDIALYKGDGRRRSGAGSSRSQYVNYNKYAGSSRDDRGRSSEPRRNRYDFSDIMFESKPDAEEVLKQMDDIMEEYKIVTVSDFYDLVGKTGEYTDQKYGWKNIRNAHVVSGRDGYRIELPKPLPIDR